jgi:para-nitrobenzyl esterase
MSGAWAALAKTGSPQHNDIPEWPPFEAESKKAMIFDNDCKVVSDPEGPGIKLIEELGDA